MRISDAMKEWNEKEARMTRPAKSGPDPLAPGLYLVPTPIGAARDITLRALDVLAGADLVLCEDTRVTRRLYAIHDLPLPPLRAYHDHSRPGWRARILAHLRARAAIALTSDGGTPLLCDPGYKLVRAALQDGIAVHALPGPCSLLPALQLSGLPPDRFTFAGFLPPRPSARRRALRALAEAPGTLILFESARRLPASLAEMASLWPARPGAVVREITKRFEEARRASLAELAAFYADPAHRPRGEVVILAAAESGLPPDTSR